jgi:hypothetical protein
MAERFSDRVVVVDAANREVLQFDAQFAALDIGQQGNEGDLRIRGDDGSFTFHLDGGRQLLVIRDGSARDVLQFTGSNALLRVGARGNEGDIYLVDTSGEVSIHLDGGSGDIVLKNADCAEEFDCDDIQQPAPGSVVVLADDGRVAVCDRPYDPRVAGVVSGAGDYRPGIVLGRDGSRFVPRVPVALAGRVACRVDASLGPVRVGDLLTTSATPGHAMAASDRNQLVGSVVGKALAPLGDGVGLLPMLVMLR